MLLHLLSETVKKYCRSILPRLATCTVTVHMVSGGGLCVNLITWVPVMEE